MSMDERTMLDSMGATSDDEGRAVALEECRRCVALGHQRVTKRASDAPQAQRARPRRYLNAATRGAQSICFENSLCEGQDCEAQVLSQIRESIQCLMEPPGADDRCGRLEARDQGARAGLCSHQGAVRVQLCHGAVRSPPWHVGGASEAGRRVREQAGSGRI